jgi:hypothetical protein
MAKLPAGNAALRLEPAEQLIGRAGGIVNAEFDAHRNGASAKIIALRLRPEAEIEDDVRAERQRVRSDPPQQRLDGRMASVVVGVIGVLTEEPHLPFIRGQPQGR